jgi:lipoate-protein ligase A
VSEILYIKNDVRNPYFNLALEEYVLKELTFNENYILLWQNKPTIVIGRNQNTIEEINNEYIKKKNICVVRRLSGGGAVYHDEGNLNFTFITNNDDSNAANFKKFTEPVIKTLQKLGVPAEFSGRNDIVIEGKKFSGNAQYYHKGKVLHHGTILFNSDLEEVKSALNVKADKIESKGIKSVRSRVTNIIDYLPEVMSINDFKDELLKQVFDNIPYKEYKLTDHDLENINKLVEERYSTWEWNYGYSPTFDFKKSHRFKIGKIEILLKVNKGVIEECKIYGDFLGISDIGGLETKLKGENYKEDNIRELLQKINIKKYFGNITNEEFMGLLF